MSGSNHKRSGPCLKCGVWRHSLHRDHVVPKWKGGSDDPSNFQYICANCHEDKTREEFTGRKFSDAHKAKIRASRQVISDKTREKLRQASTGRIVSPETRAKIRASNLACYNSPSKRALGNLGNTGRKFSAEHCRKISEGLKAALARKKGGA